MAIFQCMTCPNLEALRIFPSFSWSGKCDSSGGKPQRTKVLWLSHGTFRDLLRKPGQVSKRKRVGALKVRYPREPASRGMSPSAGNRRTGSTVAQHDGRVLGEKIGKTHCARLDELAKWLVIMPRVEFLQ